MISINLLPEEILISEKEKVKKSRATKIIVAILSLMVLITGGVLVYSFIKAQEQKTVAKNLTKAEQFVNNYKDQEGYLSLIKQRLSNIKTIRTKENKQVETFTLINRLIPEEIEISEINISRNGGVLISGQTYSPVFLSSLVENMLDKKKNNRKISKIRVENVSRLVDGSYKFEISTVVK